MPIKVSCHCGANFSCKDELAGQTLLCPKCSQPLVIEPAGTKAAPKQQNISDLFDEIGLKEHKGQRCPNCMSPLTANAVICTSCGFHLQTGQRIEGAKIYKSGERGHAEATDTLLDRAAKQIETDKVEAKKNQSQGMPAWVLFLALSLLIGFVATMFMIPRDKAFTITGGCLLGFGALMSAYFNIRMIMVAFTESTTCGILYILFSPYQLYYWITRWDRVSGFFLMSLMYSLVAGFGMGMMALAPMMAPSKEGETSQSGRNRPPAVVIAGDVNGWKGPIARRG